MDIKNIQDFISSEVAQQANDEYSYNNEPINERILDLFPEDMTIKQKKEIFENAFVYCMMESFPGCLPENGGYYSSDNDPRDIIIDALESQIEECDEDDDIIILEDAIEDVKQKTPEQLSNGWFIDLPNHTILEFKTMSCAEIMNICEMPEIEFENEVTEAPKV